MPIDLLIYLFCSDKRDAFPVVIAKEIFPWSGWVFPHSHKSHKMILRKQK